MLRWDRFVCVDWGKELSARSAWVGEVGMRRVAPLEVDEVTLGGMLEVVRALPGRSVIGIDAALGVPRHYLEGARRAVGEWRDADDFLSWVLRAVAHPGLATAARSAGEWRYDRPFIAVPAGKGSLEAFWARCGGKLMREVDVATGAKSPFVVSGIPGTVGSGTRALWIELALVLESASDLAIWPFDGSLETITKRIALAEIYPRVSYALALAAALPARITPLPKGSKDARVAAVAELERAEWVRRHGVALRDLDLAREDEDHFDAMISAAAMLRCALDGHALDVDERDPIEGGILGLASIEAGSSGRETSAT